MSWKETTSRTKTK